MRREEYPKCPHCADGRMANNQGGSIWCDRCESPTAIEHATTVLPPCSIHGQPYHACGNVYFERIENRDGHGDVRVTFKWPDGTIECEEQIPSFIWESVIGLMSANGAQAYEAAIAFHRGRMGTRSQSDELLIAGLRNRIEELELQVHALDSPCETCNGSGSIEVSPTIAARSEHGDREQEPCPDCSPAPPELVLVRLKEPLPAHFKREQPALWMMQTADGYQDFNGTTWKLEDFVELRRAKYANCQK